MCTPIQIDGNGIDLSDPTKLLNPDGTPITPATAATPSAPAGTGATAPGPATTTNTSSPVQKDTPALAADEGRVFVPGADYPGAVTADPTAGGTPATTPAATDAGTPTPTGPDTAGPEGTPGASGDPITDQNTLLINSLTNLAHQFSDTTAGILAGQTAATQALTGGFLNLSDQQQKALDAANELRKNTGQAARKPSYSLSMAKTQRANSQGAASTMLTGSGGVPTNQLALGRAQLLGGAAA